MQPGHALAVGGINGDVKQRAFLGQAFFDGGKQLVNALTIKRRDQNAIVTPLGMRFAGREFRRSQKIGLVPDLNNLFTALLIDAKLRQDNIDIFSLRFRFSVVHVAHVENDISRQHLLQCCAE